MARLGIVENFDALIPEQKCIWGEDNWFYIPADEFHLPGLFYAKIPIKSQIVPNKKQIYIMDNHYKL